MPSPQQPQSSSSHRPITPSCSACGKQMRLVGVRATAHLSNVELWSYRCMCGEVIDSLVANEH